MKQNNNALWMMVDADETVVVPIGSVVVVLCPGGAAVVSKAAVVVVGVSPTATSRGAPLGTCCEVVK